MEGLVNMRMHIDEADRARAMRAATSASGILIGAWVGGRYELTAERLYFTPKAYGMKHPKPITIPLASIRQIGEGRMLILFPTIDLITAQGTFRLRLPPGKTAMFRERLRVLSAHLR